MLISRSHDQNLIPFISGTDKQKIFQRNTVLFTTYRTMFCLNFRTLASKTPETGFSPTFVQLGEYLKKNEYCNNKKLQMSCGKQHKNFCVARLKSSMQKKIILLTN